MKQNWEYKKLGDACRDVTDFVAAGSFADLRKNVVYNSEPDFAQLIRTTDLKRKFTNSDYVYVSKSAFEYLWRVNLDKACIILPNVGNCGEVYYVSPNSLPYENNVLGPNAVLVRSYTENQRFLAYAFKGKDFQSQLNSIIGTVAQPKFNKTNLKNLTVPVPPLDEQQRIVAELDLLTEVIDNRRMQLKELDTLAQSVFYDMFGDPVENEKGWNIKTFSDVCEVTSSKRVYQSEWQTSGIPFYRISDFARLTENDAEIEAELFISQNKYDELKQANQVPKPGDILVTARGTLGTCYIIKDNDCFYFQDGMITWLKNLTNQVNPLFVVFLFKNQSFRRQIDKSQAGSTVAYLSISMMKKFVLPLPPLALQQEFACKIQSIEKQKAVINQSIADTQKLLDYTMDKYFG